MKKFTLHLGDCLEVMKTLPDNAVDSVVTDPPYELGFMGKAWDSSGIAYNVGVWRECLRILKPGGYLLAFGGSRTYHRLACAIEDAGFEIRDQIQWIYGSGFPKSLDISKAIDKRGEGQYRRAYVQAVQEAGLELPANSKWDWMIGEHSPGNKWWKTFCEWLPSLSEVDRDRVQRIVVGKGFRIRRPSTVQIAGLSDGEFDITIGASEESRQWEGFGTALKPAHEPIVMARKPLSEKTVAENILKWGTGAINIDASRVPCEPWHRPASGAEGYRHKNTDFRMLDQEKNSHEQGRFPANVIHDGSDEVEAAFASFGEKKSGNGGDSIEAGGQGNAFGHFNGGLPVETIGDSGSVSRFFYCAKASGDDRPDWNNHPTVKPVALMRYLCRLVTPPGGIVLDPFAGSGSTGVGAAIEGFEFIGIEKEKDSLEIAEARISRANLVPIDPPASKRKDAPTPLFDT